MNQSLTQSTLTLAPTKFYMIKKVTRIELNIISIQAKLL